MRTFSLSVRELSTRILRFLVAVVAHRGFKSAIASRPLVIYLAIEDGWLDARLVSPVVRIRIMDLTRNRAMC